MKQSISFLRFLTLLFFTKTYGYSGLSPSNTSFSITMDNQHRCNVSFSEISAVNSSDPKGIILNAGGTHTIRFELSGDATPKMYYVEFKMRNNTKWNGVSRVLFLKNVTVSAEPICAGAEIRRISCGTCRPIRAVPPSPWRPRTTAPSASIKSG